MERVAVDIMGPLPKTNDGNLYIMVVGDYFSKWTEAYLLKDHTAQTVADVLVEQFVARFGVMRSLHSDQGREFESDLIAELCKPLCIHKSLVVPYNPKSDGLVERANRTVVQMLTTLVSEARNDWYDHLPFVMMAYRASVHESTKFTPNRLMLNHETNLPIDLMVGSPPETPTCPVFYVEWVKDASEHAFEFVQRNLKVSADTPYGDSEVTDVDPEKTVSEHKSVCMGETGQLNKNSEVDTSELVNSQHSDLNATISYGTTSPSVPSADLDETMPYGMDEQTMRNSDLDATIPYGTTSPSVPRADLDETMPYGMDGQTMPNSDLNATIPYGTTSPSVPSADLDETMPYGMDGQTMPNSDLNATIPYGTTSPSVPSADLDENMPYGMDGQTMPNSDLNATIPYGTTSPSVPSADLNQTIPYGMDEQTMPNSDLDATIPYGTTSRQYQALI